METSAVFNSDLHLRRLENVLKDERCLFIFTQEAGDLLNFVTEGNPQKVADMLFRVCEKANYAIGENIAEEFLKVFFENHEEVAVELLYKMAKHRSPSMREFFYKCFESSSYNIFTPLAKSYPEETGEWIVKGLDIIKNPKQLFLVSTPFRQIVAHDPVLGARFLNCILDKEEVSPEIKAVALNNSLHLIMRHDMNIAQGLIDKAAKLRSPFVNSIIKTAYDVTGITRRERTISQLQQPKASIQ